MEIQERRSNNLLIEARKLLGLSQKRVAEEVDTDTETVGRWERGQQKVSPHYQEKLCKLFKKNAEELGFLERPGGLPQPLTESKTLSETEPKEPQVSPAFSASYVDMQGIAPIVHRLGEDVLDTQRRLTLQGILTTACSAFVLTPYEMFHPEAIKRLAKVLGGHAKVDAEAIDDLDVITQSYWRLCRNVPIFDLLDGVQKLFQNVSKLLSQSRPEAITKRLHTLSSEIALILGNMLVDIHEYSLAWSYYAFALHAARQVGNNDLQAAGLGRMGLLSIHNKQFQVALPPVQQGLNLEVQDKWIHAWLLAIQAEVLSHIGENDACMNSLDGSEQLTENHPFEKELYTTRFNSSLLSGYKGVCFLALGKMEPALNSLQTSLSSLDSSAIRRKSVVLADIGTVYAHHGELEGVNTYATQSLDIILRTGSLVDLDRIYALRTLLNNQRNEPIVKKLDEQIHYVHSQIVSTKPTTIP